MLEGIAVAHETFVLIARGYGNLQKKEYGQMTIYDQKTVLFTRE